MQIHGLELELWQFLFRLLIGLLGMSVWSIKLSIKLSEKSSKMENNAL